MPTYTLELEIFGIYGSDVPQFEIWAEGSLDSTHSALSTGSTISVTITYGGALPSSLEFRFNDALPEGGRTIEIRSVKINDKYVNTGNYLSTDSLTNGGAAGVVDVADSDFVFEPSVDMTQFGGASSLTGGNDFYYNHSNTDLVIDALGGNDNIIVSQGNDSINGGAGNDYISTGVGEDYIFGDTGDDTIWAGDGDDTVFAGDDNDRVYGGDGDDELHGGDGDDKLSGQDGDDEITGGAGNDKITGGSGTNYLYGDAGDDRIMGGSGIDTIDGGADNDVLFGGGNNDIIDGGDGDDNLYGGNGDDTLNGNDGDDIILGMNGDDTMYGSDGDDYIIGGTGADTADGGADDDIIIGNNAQYVTIDATTLLSYAGGQDGASTITYFTGGVTLDGNSWKKILVDYTITANTVIEFDFKSTFEGEIHGIGFDNDDNIDNGTTTFKLYGTQTWSRDFHDFENYDGSGDWSHYKIDVGSYFTGNFSHLTLIGDDDSGPTGNGHWANIIIYESTASVDDDILNGSDGIDQLFGEFGDDTLNGGAGNDVLNGNDGDDTLNGGDGDDTLYGAAGDDTLNGGDGDDTLYGSAEAGLDTVADILAANPGLTYNASTGNFYQWMSSGTNMTKATAVASVAGDLVNGVAGHLITITSAEEQTVAGNLVTSNWAWIDGSDSATEGTFLWESGPEAGTAFDHTVLTWFGGSPASTNTAARDNVIIWDGGGDTLYAWTNGYGYVAEWEGSDVLGTTGTNTLSGGDGSDTLYGTDSRQDIFVFLSGETGTDTINNFTAADDDAIDISDLLTGYTAGVSDINDFVQFTNSGADTLVQVDANGTTGGSSYTTIATITNVNDLDADALLYNGSIIA